MVYKLILLVALFTPHAYSAKLSPELLKTRYSVQVSNLEESSLIARSIRDYGIRHGIEELEYMAAQTGPDSSPLVVFGANPAHAKIVLPLIANLGFEAQHQSDPHNLSSYFDPQVLAWFKDGNDIVIRYARRMQDPSETAPLGTLVREMKREYEEWKDQQVVYQEKEMPLHRALPHAQGQEILAREVYELERAALLLSNLSSEKIVMEFDRAIRHLRPLAAGLEQIRRAGLDVEILGSKMTRFTLQDWERFKELSPGLTNVISGIQEQLVHYDSMSPAQQAMESQIKLVEGMLWPWVIYLYPTDAYSDETLEFLAHGFLKTLGELEAATDELTSGPFVKPSQIVDVLNRNLVIWKWMFDDRLLGPKRRELLTKLVSYEGLLPYLNLTLNLKLARESNQPLSASLQQDYEKLASTLSFEAGENVKARYMRLHFGPLFNAVAGLVSVKVNDGVIAIDNWFREHGLPVHDWDQVKGISMDIARSQIEERRNVGSCNIFGDWFKDGKKGK